MNFKLFLESESAYFNNVIISKGSPDSIDQYINSIPQKDALIALKTATKPKDQDVACLSDWYYNELANQCKVSFYPVNYPSELHRDPRIDINDDYKEYFNLYKTKNVAIIRINGRIIAYYENAIFSLDTNLDVADFEHVYKDKPDGKLNVVKKIKRVGNEHMEIGVVVSIGKDKKYFPIIDTSAWC